MILEESAGFVVKFFKKAHLPGEDGLVAEFVPEVKKVIVVLDRS